MIPRYYYEYEDNNRSKSWWLIIDRHSPEGETVARTDNSTNAQMIVNALNAKIGA